MYEPICKPHILICPDKFKGTASAAEAASAIALGVRSVLPTATVRMVPVADGGEGTLDALRATGAASRFDIVANPLGRPVRAEWLLHNGHAYIEMAQASGLALFTSGPSAALRAETYGTGELIRAALDAGASAVTVALGGSGTTDGGGGALRALGARLVDATGLDLDPGGSPLELLDRIDVANLDPRLRGVPITLWCDVSSPLIGPRGAARSYAAQKGADAAGVRVLEAGLRRLSDVILRGFGIDLSTVDGSGAAGGMGGGLHGVLGAEIRAGADAITDVIGLTEHLDWADLVIVGEGSMDEQSLAGKAPVAVSRQAASRRVPAAAIAGRLAVPQKELDANGIRFAASASEIAGSVDASVSDPARWIREAAESVAHWYRAAVERRDGEP